MNVDCDDQISTSISASRPYMPEFEPVLLARIDKPDSASLAGYRADGGYEALREGARAWRRTT